MSRAMAATCIAVGLIALAWAVMVWKKHPSGNSRWIPFLMVVSGLCLGVGAGSLAGINIVQYRIGFLPLWVVIVAVIGFGFFLEMKGWGDHRTRTPVLGFVTALVLMLAVGNSAVVFSNHEIHQVRTTSNIVPASAPTRG